jgi:hypothetical protein
MCPLHDDLKRFDVASPDAETHLAGLSYARVALDRRCAVTYQVIVVADAPGSARLSARRLICERQNGDDNGQD